MDIDRPSLAAAALYDLKNEQLQLANAVFQQQAAAERNQQGTSTESKKQQETTNQAVTTTTVGTQQFTEEGEEKYQTNYFYSQFCLFSNRNWSRNSI
jgi:hypothetical protein